ncbi:hypothetical protein [Aquisphaera insulae]|uniref:hypothetical protein n=1 Tax=Aquisphaera insulae TaxID=2712864 RepID=UPI0013EA1B26|nr:hypothetical protein [Aquisphaera insulae]
MSTSSTETPLVVSTDGTAGPYVIVAADRVDSVVKALRDGHISVASEGEAVILDGRPAFVVIDLGPDSDIKRAQAILDEIGGGPQVSGPDRRAPDTPLEMIIKGPAAEMEALNRRIESGSPTGWDRRKDLEFRARKLRARGAGAYCFSRKLGPDDPEFAIWLEPRGAGEIYVSSIVPLGAGQAYSIDRHNAILEDFEETFVGPMTQGLKARPILYDPPRGPSLEDLLPVETMSRLAGFSDAANKNALHPLDILRWNEFVAASHADDAVVDGPMLSDWLAGQGWQEPERRRLVEDYQRGRALLSIYDEARAER